MTQIKRGSFDAPDDVRRLPLMAASLVRVGSLGIGRAVIQAGWRWSVHTKPIVGTEWCEIHHLQLIVSGHMGIRMADGETVELGPNEVCDIPPGHDAWTIGDDPLVVVDMYGNVDTFGLPTSHERSLATLLMTDIVDSTGTAGRLGDVRWRQLLGSHNRLVRSALAQFRGHEVNTTGDGFLTTFGSAVAALQCAIAIRDATHDLGVEVRVGVHTGEIDLLPDDIGGLAVHAVARLMALGGAGEVVVSATTRGLVDGSGLRFEDRGTHQLKGLEAPMQVYLLLG